MTMACKQTSAKSLTNLENEKNILWRNCKIFMNICNERKARVEALNFSVLALDESSWNSLSTLENRNFSESMLMSFCVKVAKTMIHLAEYDYLFFHHIKIKYFSSLASLREWFWWRLTNVEEQLHSVEIDFVLEDFAFLYRKYMYTRFQLWNIVNDIRVKLARSMSNNNADAFISSQDVMYKLLKVKHKMEKFQKHYNGWYKGLEDRLENIPWKMNNNNITTVKEIEDKIDAFEMSLCCNRENSLGKTKTTQKKRNRRKKNDYDSDDNTSKDDGINENHDHDLKQISGLNSSNDKETTILDKHLESTSTVSNNLSIVQPLMDNSKELKFSPSVASSTPFSSYTRVNPSSMSINRSVAHDTEITHATENSSKTVTDNLPRSGLFTKYADNKNSSQVMRKIRDLFSDLFESTPSTDYETHPTDDM